MTNDVFICYTPEDEGVAEHIKNLFENNSINCWFKKRDYDSEKDSVKTISNAIRDSKCMVLVCSNDAVKSMFVTTEVDIAFSSNVEIIIFNIDDSKLEGKLQFYLKDKPTIEAFPNTDEYYDVLLEDTQKLLNKSVEKSDKKNDVSLCYNDEDEKIAEAVCHVLEENEIKCWFKKRDYAVNDTVRRITESIKNSKCVVLISSKDSVKSKYVETETDLALSESIPILSFRIDDSFKPQHLSDVHWLDAYPNPENYFKTLVVDAGNLVDKKIDNPKITSNYESIEKREETPEVKPDTKPVKSTSGNSNQNYKISKNFKIIIAALVVIFVLAIGAYIVSTHFFDIVGDDYMIVKDNEGTHLDKKAPKNTLEMTTTKQRLNSTHCKIWAKLYTEPDNFDDYTINAKYYDESGNVIGESTNKMNNVSEDDDGKLIIIDYRSDKRILEVEFDILDENGNQVFHQRNSKN